MALQINYTLIIPYSLDRFVTKEDYSDKLTTGQLAELETTIEKTFIIQNAYCKINSISGDKDSITIILGIYKDSTKQVLIINESYTFTPDINSSKNFIQQGYENLKTLDKFKGYIDVLDKGQAF